MKSKTPVTDALCIGTKDEPSHIRFDALVKHTKRLELKLTNLEGIVHKATTRFFVDGTGDGQTAADMLKILSEADKLNINK